MSEAYPKHCICRWGGSRLEKGKYY